ncbi:mannosyltransferase B [Synechocystis sp. PCC 6803]|uniref:Mannosyltransferase B n=1 Tax=Synechocystis sp. (strain ATCC 27184 / PCC 6803 / Kazusa) TaxID=1111708 RepID=P72900_SYNY3|nr:MULTISPECIES: glycosyltransferase family 1 protein [unclassified Synechocystis]BAM50628.1 mannosyltransferase [Synechocystis sp. PCC 6803] [Bacillus subtilis BEST7613]AGF50605.1 mannosyltransferase B [Synechocystis sp. PCC 6803]ALJ66683.1 mannosyltransferase [Synechocystis sp. PCC 6803]AVP88526.1 glycosyltransferase family 1 protein [Synechocystis sp. IPPAS B-1465]MBD2617204.1 glycosyltransferase family 4 protein [Synechocystis sp. FACHB-898]
MKIFYDGLIYAAYSKQSGGISRYFDNLISRLPEDFYPGLTTGREKTGSHPIHPHLELYRFDLRFRPGRICNWVRKEYFQYLSEKYKPQLAHPTYYSLLTGRRIESYQCPVVITVHDMIHEIFADYMDPNGEQAEIKRNAILAAQAILCNSENTKRDLLNQYPALENRVSVTYLATEFSEDNIDVNASVPTQPYFLYVGARGTYKNFDQLLLAFQKVTAKPKYADLLLCVVGSPFENQEKERLEFLGLSKNVVHYGRATDGQLAKLYNQSIAFVYPSLYEGFGIPPLEAMACGTAVIGSNVSSIPEVVGDAGLLFDPKSMDQLVDQLLYVLENPIKRDSLIQKGKKQCKKFSWDKTAQQTVETYRSLL